MWLDTGPGWCWSGSLWWWHVGHWCCRVDCRSWSGPRIPGGSRWFLYPACRWWNQSAAKTRQIGLINVKPTRSVWYKTKNLISNSNQMNTSIDYIIEIRFRSLVWLAWSPAVLSKFIKHDIQSNPPICAANWLLIFKENVSCALKLVSNAFLQKQFNLSACMSSHLAVTENPAVKVVESERCWFIYAFINYRPTLTKLCLRMAPYLSRASANGSVCFVDTDDLNRQQVVNSIHPTRLHQAF